MENIFVWRKFTHDEKNKKEIDLASKKRNTFWLNNFLIRNDYKILIWFIINYTIKIWLLLIINFKFNFKYHINIYNNLIMLF